MLVERIIARTFFFKSNQKSSVTRGSAAFCTTILLTFAIAICFA
jgi:hypothetical protein